LNEIIPLLKDSYRGIDVRGVLAKSRSEDRWYYVFLKIRLTKDDPTILQEIYHKKHEQLGSINHDDFKVVFDSRDIQQIETFLNEIQNGPIILNGIVAWPIGTESQNIFENLLSMYKIQDHDTVQGQPFLMTIYFKQFNSSGSYWIAPATVVFQDDDVFNFTFIQFNMLLCCQSYKSTSNLYVYHISSL
jgi:hypothetical protein